jgi:hypothetical protein
MLHLIKLKHFLNFYKAVDNKGKGKWAFAKF